MKLLAFRVCEHDSNFSFYDGKELKYFKSERHTKIKHHAYNDLTVWKDVVKEIFKCDPKDIDQIAVVADPWLYKNIPHNSDTEKFFPAIEFPYIKSDCPVYRIDHHYAHSLSVYDNFDTHMIFDGYGDLDIVWSVIKDDKIIERGDGPAHSSLGAAMGTIAEYFFKLKVRHKEDFAGKLMALQSHGKLDKKFLQKLNYNIYQVRDLFDFEKWKDHRGDKEVAKLSSLDWITTAHEKAGDVLVDIFKKHCKPEEKICFTGGVALNIVWNTKLKKHFPNLYVPPHTSDDALSLGAIEYLRRKNNLPEFKLNNFPYIQSDEKPNALPNKDTIKRTAKLLAEGKTVAWYQGNGEIGPRALGNRSIFLDPRIKNGKEIINKIKNRENYRPFGASILHEKAHEVFKDDYVYGPYMTYTANIEGYPAITHVDNTCRYQSVTDGYFYDMLKEFYNATGCPILLNTSLNVDGEPIAGHISQAIQLFKESNLDCLVIGNSFLLK